jgi:hypothetical protein
MTTTRTDRRTVMAFSQRMHRVAYAQGASDVHASRLLDGDKVMTDIQFRTERQ